MQPALLALADGTLFRGESIGVPGLVVGELVFNTAMSGYQEILTDPSYARQLITLTSPHIGNTGTNDEDMESATVHAGGLIIRDLPLQVSNYRSQQSLPEFLARHKVVALAGIDTRRLTRLLRERGAQNACLWAAASGERLSARRAIAEARAFGGLVGLDLAKVVSVRRAYDWQEGSWVNGCGHRMPEQDRPFRVVAYDFGIKRNILRRLVDCGCTVTVVPAQTPASEVLAMRPDGVFLSNGPGDPEPCTYAIEAVRALADSGTPVFGICLGHQLIGLAAGARTIKMKFGHHGANHPVVDLASGRVMITSQNHGFAVDDSHLGEHLAVTHRSLFDGSVQGLQWRDRPVFCFQGHPEASPGPHDVSPLFERFTDLMRQRRDRV
ncbi:MAG TPA: glutamine-hydrolyzing carbamoyl-phosphate synthase small subunit [Acidiferrobacteraceae bacterium]|nr:glutamine-hydrolyzing carbamoyl-phosphate synthase small subunit [Acidiferrobacteraceae bacterium]